MALYLVKWPDGEHNVFRARTLIDLYWMIDPIECPTDAMIARVPDWSGLRIVSEKNKVVVWLDDGFDTRIRFRSGEKFFAKAIDACPEIEAIRRFHP